MRFERTGEHGPPLTGEYYDGGVWSGPTNQPTEGEPRWILRPLPDAPADESELDRAVRVLSGLKPKPAAEPDPAPWIARKAKEEDGQCVSVGGLVSELKEPDPAPLPSAEEFALSQVHDGADHGSLIDSDGVDAPYWFDRSRGSMVHVVARLIRRRDAQHAARYDACEKELEISRRSLSEAHAKVESLLGAARKAVGISGKASVVEEIEKDAAAARPAIDQHGLLCEISYAVTMDDAEIAKVRGLIAQYCGAARKAVDVVGLYYDIINSTKALRWDGGNQGVLLATLQNHLRHLGAGRGEVKP